MAARARNHEASDEKNTARFEKILLNRSMGSTGRRASAIHIVRKKCGPNYLPEGWEKIHRLNRGHAPKFLRRPR
jgi:hypothetical protein